MNILEILQSVPEGPQHDFQSVGRYTYPAQLSVCIHCGGAPDAPQHLIWRKRTVQTALEITERESSFDPTVAQQARSQGLFQTYLVGDSNGEPPLIIGPIEDSLKNFRVLGWGGGPLTAHIRDDGSGEIYMEDDDGTT